MEAGRKKTCTSLLALLFIFLPAFSFAQTLEAGFPPQSVWVSNTKATAGDTIEIFTVVYNGSGEKLSGTVVFTVNGEKIGAKDFELAEGASALVSAEWKARTGEHRVAAALEDTSAELTQKETATITITVAEPPPPPPLVNAAVIASEVIADAAQAATPVITEVANTTYEFIESLRLEAVSKLEKAAGENATAGGVAGTSTASVSGSNEGEANSPSGLSQMKQVAAAAALFALNSKGVFYPLFLLSLFGLLYLLFRWATKRPRVRY